MSSKEVKAAGSIEETLLHELRFGGLEKENLEELVGIVAGMHKKGFTTIKAFTKGVPVVDGLRVSGIVKADELSMILGEILTGTSRLAGMYVFPKGIPFPDIFRVDVDLGLAHSDPMPG